MPRGGARPGAGRPPKHAAEMKRDRAARVLGKCQDMIQENLPELMQEAIKAALAGDKNLLKFLIENGMGKAPVKQQATPDTEIKVVLGNIPRPSRKGMDAKEAGPDGADTGEDSPGADAEMALEEGAELPEWVQPAGTEEVSS
jgi:hypothetical protein